MDRIFEKLSVISCILPYFGSFLDAHIVVRRISKRSRLYFEENYEKFQKMGLKKEEQHHPISFKNYHLMFAPLFLDSYEIELDFET